MAQTFENGESNASIRTKLNNNADQIDDNTAALGNKVDKDGSKVLSDNNYTNAEKSKLAGIESGAQVNVATNIGVGTRTSTTVPLTSSTGSATTLNAATSSLAGVMTAADKTKVDASVPSTPAGGGSAIVNQFTLTEAQYNALTPVSGTVYLVTA